MGGFSHCASPNSVRRKTDLKKSCCSKNRAQSWRPSRGRASGLGSRVRSDCQQDDRALELCWGGGCIWRASFFLAVLCGLWDLSSLTRERICALCERLLLLAMNDAGILGLWRRRIQSGPVTKLHHSELLCNQVLLKYKRDRESFWRRHQRWAERVPPC